MTNYILTTFGVALIALGTFPSFAEKPEPVVITHEQEVYLHTLEFCESRGKTDIKILDSNDRYSYGALQFQMETFLSQGKKYGILATSTTPAQGEKLIYNLELQEAIAHRMLQEGGKGHWYNCTKRMGKYPTSP